MSTSIDRARVLQEIDQIPDDRLTEIFNLLHYYRLGIDAERERPLSAMRFAGSWGDLPDDVFESFAREIAERREQAFSRRRRQ